MLDKMLNKIRNITCSKSNLVAILLIVFFVLLVFFSKTSENMAGDNSAEKKLMNDRVNSIKSKLLKMNPEDRSSFSRLVSVRIKEIQKNYPNYLHTSFVVPTEKTQESHELKEGYIFSAPRVVTYKDNLKIEHTMFFVKDNKLGFVTRDYFSGTITLVSSMELTGNYFIKILNQSNIVIVDKDGKIIYKLVEENTNMMVDHLEVYANDTLAKVSKPYFTNFFNDPTHTDVNVDVIRDVSKKIKTGLEKFMTSSGESIDSEYRTSATPIDLGGLESYGILAEYDLLSNVYTTRVTDIMEKIIVQQESMDRGKENIVMEECKKKQCYEKDCYMKYCCERECYDLFATKETIAKWKLENEDIAKNNIPTDIKGIIRK